MEESELIYEIKVLPKATFLKIVATSSELTQDEKEIVANTVFPDVYTHATLQKAEYRGTRFFVIDQFYPKQTVGKDVNGGEIVEGGSGTVQLVLIGVSNGFQMSSYHYD